MVPRIGCAKSKVATIFVGIETLSRLSIFRSMVYMLWSLKSIHLCENPELTRPAVLMFFVVTMSSIHEEIGNVGVSIKVSVCSCLFDLKQRCA